MDLNIKLYGQMLLSYCLPKYVCQQSADMTAEGENMKNIAVEKLQISGHIKKALLNAGIKDTEVLAKRIILDGLTSIEGIGAIRAEELACCLDREGVRWYLNNYERFVLDVCFQSARQRRVYARKFLETPINNSQIVMIWEFLQKMEETYPNYSKVLKDYYELDVDEKVLSAQSLAQTYETSEAQPRQLVRHRGLLREYAMQYFRFLVMQASDIDGLDGYQVLLDAHLSEEQETRKWYCIAPPRCLSFCHSCEYSFECEEYSARSKVSEVNLTEDLPFAYLDLSLSTYMVLRRAGLKSIADILAADLGSVRNLKGKRRAEIEEKLTAYGFLLKS